MPESGLTTALVPASYAHLDHAGEYVGPCVYCGKPTCWIDWNFVAPLCPGDCYTRMWQEYWEVSAPLDPPVHPPR